MFANRGFSIWTPSLDGTVRFFAIDNPQAVFTTIQRAAHEARTRR